MKLSEMRALPLENIPQEVQNRKKELMELRFQATVGQLANPARVRQLRREVAQLLTIQTEQTRVDGARE